MAVAYEELLANHNGYAFKLENIAGNDFETGMKFENITICVNESEPITAYRSLLACHIY